MILQVPALRSLPVAILHGIQKDVERVSVWTLKFRTRPRPQEMWMRVFLSHRSSGSVWLEDYVMNNHYDQGLAATPKWPRDMQGNIADFHTTMQAWICFHVTFSRFDAMGNHHETTMRDNILGTFSKQRRCKFEESSKCVFASPWTQGWLIPIVTSLAISLVNGLRNNVSSRQR